MEREGGKGERLEERKDKRKEKKSYRGDEFLTVQFYDF